MKKGMFLKRVVFAIIFANLVLLSNCKKKEESSSPSSSTTTSGSTVIGTGDVKITVNWVRSYPPNVYNPCDPAWTVVCGLGYSSTDVANEAYFSSLNAINPPHTFTFTDL